jgi:hypothetical protein
MADRAFAQRLIEQYVPYDLPYHKDFEQSIRMHNEIINRFRLPNHSTFSEYAGVGTTCGFLCQWLLFRLGVRDQNILNRTTFKASLKPSSEDFDDLSRMGPLGSGFKLPKSDRKGKLIPPRKEDDIHFKTFFVPAQNLKFCMRPEMTKLKGTNFNLEKLKNIKYGDIGWIKGPDKKKVTLNIDDAGIMTETSQNLDTSHVFIIKSKSEINNNKFFFETVDGGQGGGSYPSGTIDVRHKTRHFNIVGNEIKCVGGENRDLWGYMSLDDLTFESPLIDFPEWLLYDPDFSRNYYRDRGIAYSTISTSPNKRY